ncbi:WxL domain-containing protein [Enterococcus faecalis]|uniref:WxL domain-containing protein n=1 Tax=Enterococcus faecalis TaxID=1351 RepID=UPI003CC5510D
MKIWHIFYYFNYLEPHTRPMIINSLFTKRGDGMKKIYLIIVLGFFTLTGMFLEQNVNANESRTTEAKVVVNPGELKFKSVDNIQFEDVKIDGKNKEIFEKGTLKAKVSIEDFRGSNSKGWILKAKLKDSNFSGMSLKLLPSINFNKDAATVESDIPNLNSQEVVIASIADNKIMSTEFDTEIQLNASLTIPARIKAATYSTTIVWNLATTPETK